MTRVKYLCTLANVIKVVSRTELWIDSWCDVISVPWSNLLHWSVPLRRIVLCQCVPSKKKTKCPAVVTQFLRLMTASPWRGCAFSKSGQVMGWRSFGTSLWLGCTCPPTRLLRPRALRGTKFWASAMLQPPLSHRLPCVTYLWLTDQWNASGHAGFWCWREVTVLHAGCKSSQVCREGAGGNVKLDQGGEHHT